MTTQITDRPAIAAPTLAVVAARHVTIALATAMLGLKERALEGKIARGVLVEGRHYHRRDGGIYIDIEAYETWVRTGK